MKHILNTNNSSINNPTYKDIEMFFSNIESKYILELSCCDDNDSFYSQMLLIFEKKYGVLLRYCPLSGENEYVCKSNNEKSEELIETYDGGDEWLVPKYCFLSIDEAETIIKDFFDTGNRSDKNHWLTLGIDI